VTLFARLVVRAERWIEDIDRERDSLANTTSWALISEVERAFVRTRLALLEKERIEALDTLAKLNVLTDRPQVMFSERPKRMLKVSLRRSRQEKSA
jgi:hypothetical protein